MVSLYAWFIAIKGRNTHKRKKKEFDHYLFNAVGKLKVTRNPERNSVYNWTMTELGCKNLIRIVSGQIGLRHLELKPVLCKYNNLMSRYVPVSEYN